MGQKVLEQRTADSLRTSAPAGTLMVGEVSGVVTRNLHASPPSLPEILRRGPTPNSPIYRIPLRTWTSLRKRRTLLLSRFPTVLP